MEVQSAVGELVRVDIDDLVDFQGALKDLSSKRYHKLKSLILKHKFSFVLHVWENDGKLLLLDGHQRTRTLRRMRDKEKYEIPKIPVVKVLADDFRQAREKVLAATSQFGEMTDQGLYGFIHDSGLDWQEVASDFEFADIDFEKFGQNFFGEPKDDRGASELDEQFILTLHCGNETQLQELFEEMQERGIQCKIVT